MTTTVKTNLGKAARILLVFALVFWGSFRIEALAYAALADPAGVDVEDVAEGDQITDLVVYEIDPEPDVENETGLGKKLASASDEGEVTVALEFDAPGETRQFVAIPAWNGKAASIDKESGKVEVANFVEWKVTGDDCAEIEASEKTPGIATLTSTAAGVVTVTCELNDEAQRKLDVSEFPGEGAEKAAFKVEIAEPVAEVSKRVSELKVSDAAGNLVSGTGVSLVLPKSQVGKAYSFQTEIKVRVLTGDVETYEPSAEGYYSLAEARDAGVNVAWSLTAGADVADINEDSGVLTFNKEGAVRVHVEASIDGAMTPADFVVKTEGAADPGSGDDPDPGDDPSPSPKPVVQGNSNPQDTLTVVSNARAAASDEEGEGSEDADANGDGSDGESVGGEGSSSSASGSSSSSSSSAADSVDEDDQPQTIEKTYSVDDLEALGTGRATYTMYDGSEFVTVTGEGPYLVALLHDLGIENTDQVESLVFENADGVTTSITWSELESASRYYPNAADGNFEDAESVSPIIALSSLVRGLGDGTGEGADAAAGDDDANADDSASGSSSSSSAGSSSSSASGSSSTAELSDGSDITLLDNTRFRLLFGSTSPARAIADPDALRYLTKITVNVKPNSGDDDPGYNTDIGVSVEYVPVPIGAPAVFSALPNTAIRDARFDFNWEVSTDDGKTWKEVENGNVQVLRVITTEERIGNKYRVVMSTDATDKDGRENVTVTSDPVTMTEGNGLAVVLEYDPPIAGQTAYFQTTLYGAKSGVVIKYTWQQSQDGGAHWADIAGRTGSSLAVPTEPIDPNAEKAGEDEAVPITYVRVIAEETSGEKRVAISEAVPLTVHVGDDDGGDPTTPTDPTDPKKPDDEKKPTPTPSTPTKPTPRVTPVDDIEIEFPEEYETPTVPTADGSMTEQVAPSQLYINDAVTEKVTEQQEAVQEYVEANVPGARWTSLSKAQATDDDVRNILADNPFAPFVFPIGLGVTVAGGVEKLLAFRRQL